MKKIILSVLLLSPWTLIDNAAAEHSEGRVSTIKVNTTPTIIFRIASAHATIGLMNVSTTVHSTASTVIASNSADQIFEDQTQGAKYYGYYMSTGVFSTSQSARFMSIKARKGSSETTDRSFYVTGNGKVKPTRESDLVKATSAYQTFASAGSNSTHCGSNFRSNHFTTLNCESGSTVESMDITQFVKVLNNDPDPTQIISQLEFTVVPE